MRERWIITIVVSLFLLFSLLFPFVGQDLREWLFSDSRINDDYEEIIRENQVLKALVATTWQMNEIANEDRGIPAFVFSRYPFNFKDELLVSVGSDKGVSEGDIVIVPLASSSKIGSYPGVFLGKVNEVYKHSSLVRTIFDSSFESAVRIGEYGVDALVRGGGAPRLILIPRRADVESGDIIYTASPLVPYGIPLGTIGEVVASEDNIFNEAGIVFSYDINHIDVVTIIRVDT